MTCKKAPFQSKKEAQTRLAEIRANPEEGYKGLPLRAYKCPACNLWHLTSMTHKQQDMVPIWKEQATKRYHREVAQQFARRKGWDIEI